jgi:hypothetical protein
MVSLRQGRVLLLVNLRKRLFVRVRVGCGMGPSLPGELVLGSPK